MPNWVVWVPIGTGVLGSKRVKNDASCTRYARLLGVERNVGGSSN